VSDGSLASAPAGWAEAATGIAVGDRDSLIGAPATDLVRLGLRDNPRRLHLLVSRVLGKHVPTDPRVVLGAGRLLGVLVADVLSGTIADPEDGGTVADPQVLAAGRALRAALSGGGDSPTASAGAARLLEEVDALVAHRAGGGVPPAVVLGFAETATAVGHCVSDALPASRYLHSTRRVVAGVASAAGFVEAHSHAPDHLLLPDDPAFLTAGSTDEALVLVDDELSTGSTAANTIEALHAQAPRSRYVIAALVDFRPPGSDGPLAELARRLGTRITVVALARGVVRIPENARQSLAAHLSALGGTPPVDLGGTPPVDRGPVPAAVTRLAVAVPAARDGARHGLRAGDRAGLDELVDSAAHAIGAAAPRGRLLVVGHEELMYAPLRMAAQLAGSGREVRFSTTTRSPALTLDRPGYPLRRAMPHTAADPDVVLPSSVHDPLARHAYNVDVWDIDADETQRPDAIALVIDDGADTAQLRAPGGLLDALALRTDRVVLVVLPAFRPGRELPEPLRGPRFGSYAPDEVGWLLTDLSGAVLEAPTEEREEAVQSGGRHYAESLPIEYVPSPAYSEAFDIALQSAADAVAQAVGVVAELIRDARGEHPVLVSLARAGTPVGILLRRWWQASYGVDLDHYAISIVRGRGIDATAMAWLAARHDPAQVMFVDGWTGKGAIVRELTAALDAHAAATGQRFSSQLAVLADPGGCVDLFGTREDVLIPSACLNSTVSGLVSRTVLNERLLSPGTFHGAKHYRQLAAADVSAPFLDAISARFDAVRPAALAEAQRLRGTDRAPTWAGWAAVEEICARYGIDEPTLVKPGIGESTRVLLRRVPWRVLVRADEHANDGSRDGEDANAAADDGLRHVLLLARDRGVPIEQVPGLPYRCVGLIHPKYTRGATGAQGVAVAVTT
jgi:hypothetical protein